MQARERKQKQVAFGEILREIFEMAEQSFESAFAHIYFLMGNF